MKKVVLSIKSVNAKQQLSALKLVYRMYFMFISFINCSVNIIPDKRRFLTSNDLLNTICSINVTTMNSGYVNVFKTIQQKNF